MSVRATESRLPAGFAASDLGQASIVGNAGTEDYALVSSLSSPISIASEIDYAVFVNTGEDVVSYDWTFDPVASGAIGTETTDIGVNSHLALDLGLLHVTVALQLAGGGVVTLSMMQEVRPVFDGFEFFFSNLLEDELGIDLTIGALGGDPVASHELVNDFRSNVLDAAAEANVPHRFLAAIAYRGTMAAPKYAEVGPLVWTPGRDQKLDWAGDELNGGLWNLRTDLDDRLGVCQIGLPAAAMIVGPAGFGGATYSQWRERAADGSDASEVTAQILADFEALPADDKIDLFNLARFPKSNIRLAAELMAALNDRPNRWPNLTVDELVADADAMAVLATEYDEGANDAQDPDPNGWGSATVGLMSLPVLTNIFYDALHEGADAYGGYDLIRGDNDAARKWGGEAPIDAANPPAGSHVRELQDDLIELGFTGVGGADGDFGRKTEWAVRELQIYAKMRYLAKETDPNAARYLERLSQTLNLYHYAGPISGIANLGTRSVISQWKRSRWRCPVIVEVWNTDRATIPTNQVPTPQQPDPAQGNIWLHKRTQPPPISVEALAETELMFARDFTGYYEFTADRQQDFDDPNDLIDLGCYFPYGNQGGPLTRPAGTYYSRNSYPATWPEAEILPERLLGVALGDLGPDELAVFKVVRAVSEIECLGFFDSVNCYDTAFVSLGPAHWTLGLSNPMREGELCGYLAYLAAFQPEAFHKGFGWFGFRIDEQWVDPATGDRSGQQLFDVDHRKYTGWVALQDDDGNYTRQFFDEPDADYFRGWHWFYRFVMAGRTIEGFRTRMWDMTRIRLRDIMDTPFPAAANLPEVPDGHGGTRSAAIGDAFTSEEAAGLLLRWHIYRPVDISPNGEAGLSVQAAVTAAGLAGDPSTWSQADHERLIDALVAEVANIPAPDYVKDDLAGALAKVRAWPNYAGRGGRNYALDPSIGSLSNIRGTFKNQFDTSDLPPAPNPAPVAP